MQCADFRIFRESDTMASEHDNEYPDWRDRYIHGELTAEEIRAIEQESEFKEVRAVLEAGRTLKAPAYSEHDAWEQFKRLRRRPESRIEALKKRRVTLLFTGLGMLVIATLSIWWYQGRDRVYSTGPGQTDQVTLPDGTRVTLHISSTLTWDPDRWRRRGRIAGFSGQAYFERPGNKPLELQHSNGSVVLVRSRADIRVRDSYFEVTTFEGQAVAMTRDTQLVVRMGTFARWDGYRWTKYPITDDWSAPPWLEGNTVIEDLPLSEVIREIERLYRVSIDLNADPDRSFSGSFPNYDLQEAITILEDRADLRADYFAGNFIVLDPLPEED